MNLRLCGQALGLVSIGFLLASCAKSGGKASGTVQVKAENPYCTGSVIAGGATITATAQFARYNDNAGGLTTTSTLPIRYAEAVVLDAAGTTVNCADTDNSGAISITIPKVAGTYTLAVNSRSNNSHNATSVLNNPTDNNYYQISASFSYNGSDSVVAVTLPTASASTGDIEGGAFNILEQTLLANEYLRANTSCTSCTTFTVAPKLQIFWTKGLNPGKYFDSSASGISYFLKTPSGSLSKGLYILGGDNGSICTDTDHFDNSVILHEYGHFLEDIYAKSDSPGGSHNGNRVIDPRLAWSEGWANFFQAAVLSRNYYRDTMGSAACGNASLAFPDFSMENKFLSDNPSYTDEGTFREMSVSRTLFDDVTGSSQDSDGYYADLGFALVWKAFTSLSNAGYHFRNSGLMHQLLSAIVTSEAPSKLTAFNDSLVYEMQRKDELNYGLNLTPQSGATCTYTFASGVPVSVTISGAYLLRNNKYYEYYYDGSAAKAVVNLRYQPSSGTPYDLNMYAYYEDHVLGDTSDIATSSARTYPESGGTGFEQINFSGKPAGTYLINVQAYYPGSAKNDTIYYLELANGDRLCP